MRLLKLLKRNKKRKVTAIEQIFEGKLTDWDDPFVIHMACDIVSDYGSVIIQTSELTFGVSEKRLPYSKSEIQKAIEVLLRFLNNRSSWSRFKKAYPDFPEYLFTNKTHWSLRECYAQLAYFIPEDEARFCEKFANIMLGTKHVTEDMVKELKELVEEVLKIQKRILEEFSARYISLEEKFGIEIPPF